LFGLSLLGILLTAGPTYGQQAGPAPGHPLLVNLKGGLNLSTYTGGGYIGWDTGLTTGYSLGLSATQRLTVRSAWQIELVYSGKGVQQDHYQYSYHGAGPPTAPDANIYEAALHYLDLPLLFTYGPGSGSRPGWFVAAGPQLSLAFDKQETVRPMGLSAADDYRETISGDAKSLTRWGQGYVLGVGYQTAEGNAGVELRYSGDFSNVYRDGYGSGALYAGSGNRFHNGVIQLQLNLALRGGHWVRGRGSDGWHNYNTSPDYDSSPTPAPRSRPPSFPRPAPAPSSPPRPRN